ncbi:hypothetical protein GCM10025794_22090 [Massilia kyonggiensis]
MACRNIVGSHAKAYQLFYICRRHVIGLEDTNKNEKTCIVRRTSQESELWSLSGEKGGRRERLA